jgi:hypothetical protein
MFGGSLGENIDDDRRQPDRINNRAGQIVDQLDRRIRIGRGGMFRIASVKPVC